MHKERPILRALNRLREHSNRTIEELLFRITLLSRENIRLLAEVQHYNQNKQPPIPPAIDYIGRPLEQLVNKLIEGQLAISQSQQSDIEQALAASLEQFELLCAELKSQQEEFRRLEVKHRQTLEECERLRRPDRIQQQTNADSLSIAQSTTDERVRAVEDERKQLAHALHQKRRFSTSDNAQINIVDAYNSALVKISALKQDNSDLSSKLAMAIEQRDAWKQNTRRLEHDILIATSRQDLCQSTANFVTRQSVSRKKLLSCCIHCHHESPIIII